MYLGRHHTGASLREIADRLGVRDISTVSHGEKRVAKGLRESGTGPKELKRALDETYSLIDSAEKPSQDFLLFLGLGRWRMSQSL